MEIDSNELEEYLLSSMRAIKKSVDMANFLIVDPVG